MEGQKRTRKTAGRDDRERWWCSLSDNRPTMTFVTSTSLLAPHTTFPFPAGGLLVGSITVATERDERRHQLLLLLFVAPIKRIAPQLAEQATLQKCTVIIATQLLHFGSHRLQKLVGGQCTLHQSTTAHGIQVRFDAQAIQGVLIDSRNTNVQTKLQIRIFPQCRGKSLKVDRVQATLLLGRKNDLLGRNGERAVFREQYW